MKTAWRSLGTGATLIILLTVVAYIPALRGGFIWDDDAYVTENRLLTAPDGLKRIWFSAHHESQYFPLVFTTLRFERMLWGLNPVGYHVVNVLLHGMNALLVWAVLRRLAVPGAWLAAAIWAVHPVNVESAAWITELKNTQSTLFYLLALLAWMKFTNSKTVRPWRFYALALLLQALALFSKTTACTLPAAMLLVLWLRKQPIGLRRFVQVAPFLVFGIAMGLLSVWWETHLGNYGAELNFPFSGLERLLIATRALWFYAAKLVWPVGLTFSYSRWEINPRDPLQYMPLIGCVAVALLLWWRRNVWGRAPVVAVIFFVAALSPLLGFIPLYTFRYSFVADHYQYVASMGMIGLVVGAGVVIFQRAGQRGRDFGTFAAVVALLVLGICTWQRGSIYKDLETLWRILWPRIQTPGCRTTTWDSCWRVRVRLLRRSPSTRRRCGSNLIMWRPITTWVMLSQSWAGCGSDRRVRGSVADQTQFCGGPQQPGQYSDRPGKVGRGGGRVSSGAADQT